MWRMDVFFVVKKMDVKNGCFLWLKKWMLRMDVFLVVKKMDVKNGC